MLTKQQKKINEFKKGILWLKLKMLSLKNFKATIVKARPALGQKLFFRSFFLDDMVTRQFASYFF